MFNTIVLATSNSGKIKEIQAILHPTQCIAQSELGIGGAEETGLSFIENAILKARYTSHHANQPALADDSGLVVPAIHGEPGIYSARYAGNHASDQDNIHRLLSRMSYLKEDDRAAYFYCAIALVRHEADPTPIIATGLFKGFITFHPSGTGGFGYDPVFYVPEYQCTAAELPASIKNKISHRAKALIQLQSLTQDLL
jgi:XTP/dITP diphosphohydrolase